MPSDHWKLAHVRRTPRAALMLFTHKLRWGSYLPLMFGVLGAVMLDPKESVFCTEVKQ